MSKLIWVGVLVGSGTSFLWAPPVLGPAYCATILVSTWKLAFGI